MYSPKRRRLKTGGSSVCFVSKIFNHLRNSLLPILPCLIAGTVLANAQVDVETATLKVVVTDQNRAVLDNAKVMARSVEKGLIRETKTNTEGVYQIHLLRPGRYEVRITADGFEPQTISDVELTVGQIRIFNIQLSIQGLINAVEVSGGVQAIEVERTQQANLVNRRQLTHLPNMSRDFTAYVFTLPGVVNSNAPRTQFVGFDAAFVTTGFSIGGSNGRSNLVTIDGGENEFGSGQLRIRTLSPEAVQEFQINRNSFAAEFGFTSGSAVNVVTRGGTNDFHGGAYIFYRSQKTSARNYFNLESENPFDQRISPGINFGGPISKNRAFLFTSYEALKADTTRFRSYSNSPLLFGPTTAQGAYLSLLTSSSDARVSRIGADLRAALTTTNYPNTMRFLRENEGALTIPTRTHNSTTRFDYQINRSDSLVGRFSLTRENQDQLGPSNEQAPGAGTILIIRDYTALTTWTHTFNSTLINQTRVQVVPNFSAKNIPRNPTSTGINIFGFAIFGHNTVTPLVISADRYQFEDALTWSHGAHNFKFGISDRPVKYEILNEIFFNGLFSFPSGSVPIIQGVPSADRAAFTAFNVAQGLPANGPTAANLTSMQTFNFGLPSQWQQGFNNARLNPLVNLLGAYAQDSFKLHRHLTIDVGVRFDYDRQPEPIGGHGYLSPRLGFAWDVGGKQKTVVRGGGGIFVSPIFIMVPLRGILQFDDGKHINQVITTSADAARSPALLWAFGVSQGILPHTALSEGQVNAFGISTGPRSLNRRINEIDPGYRNSYSIQASFGISRHLASDLALDVNWVMQRSVHLPLSHNANYRETNDFDPIFGPRLARIDPTIAVNNVFKSIGNSIYHGMTVSITKRFSRNFQFEANYTWSKAIDDVTDFNGQFFVFLPTRLYLERAVSTFDIPHNFVVNAVMQSPWKKDSTHKLWAKPLVDITVSAIASWRSGIPFTGRAGRDVNGDASVNYDRPFAEGRNTGRGANFANLDLRFEKRFALDREGRRSVNFIAEANNVFNHTNFLSVNDVIGGDPQLLRGPFNFRGRRDLPPTAPLGFTSAADARQIQFGLKVSF